jgi:hypothetical protein
MYYAKLDTVTGELYSCMESEHGSIEPNIMYFSETDHDVIIFCKGWNALLKSLKKEPDERRWIILKNRRMGRSMEYCNKLMDNLVGKSITHLLSECTFPMDLDSTTSDEYGIWYVRVEKYVYAVSIKKGIIDGILYCNSLPNGEQLENF